MFLVVIVVVLTSTLSGFIGMGGGMILMGVLASVLPVQKSMVIHGFVQLISNSSRAYGLRHHIFWKILPVYFLGMVSALLFLSQLVFMPSKQLIFICLGLFSFMTIVSKNFLFLDITKNMYALVCGFLVTVVKLTCGASGPLLDVFYLNSNLNRFEVIATKAITQSLGHLFKIIYYSWFVGGLVRDPQNYSYVFLFGVGCAAVLGTKIGKSILGRLEEQKFNKWSQYLILVIGSVFLVKGVMFFK